MAAVAAFDDAALTLLFTTNKYRLRCYVVRILKERDGVSHADDVVQQAFTWMLGTMRDGKSPTSERHATGALFRAARNFALQALVENGLSVPTHVKTGKAMPVDFLDLGYHSKPGDEMDNAILRASLIDALAKLPRRERDVFLRCEYRGDSHDEVADELGMRKPQVALTLWNARNRVSWHIEHGDRPYCANRSRGIRKTLVRKASISAAEKARKRLAENRRYYAQRKLAETAVAHV